MMPTRFLLVLSFTCVSLGCGSSGPARYPVSGTVTFQGQPISEGSIQFLPLDGGASSGGAPILAGKYQVPKQNGLLPGNYRVIIHSGTTGQTPTEPPGPGVPVAQERIPAKYNKNSTLTAEIKADDSNVRDFPLQ